MLRLYVIGIAILLVAILANGIVIRLGVKSWYSFIELMSRQGLSAFNVLSFVDVLWLFIGYPMILGFGYWLGDKLCKLLF